MQTAGHGERSQVPTVEHGIESGGGSAADEQGSVVHPREGGSVAGPDAVLRPEVQGVSARLLHRVDVVSVVHELEVRVGQVERSDHVGTTRFRRGAGRLRKPQGIAGVCLLGEQVVRAHQLDAQSDPFGPKRVHGAEVVGGHPRVEAESYGHSFLRSGVEKPSRGLP